MAAENLQQAANLAGERLASMRPRRMAAENAPDDRRLELVAHELQ